MLNQITQLKAKNPVVLDHIEYTWVERTYTRKREQDEFKLIASLRLAVLMSAFKSTNDELLDDPRIERRVNALLDHVRFHAPTLKFHARFTRTASEIIPGIYLKINHACTEVALYREPDDNVVYMLGA